MVLGFRSHSPIGPGNRGTTPTRQEVVAAVTKGRADASRSVKGLVQVELRPGVKIDIGSDDVIDMVVKQVMEDLKNYHG